ncbi:MAG TPA: nucleoside deaminase [Planctomycetaceae bacterium]|nr:nucleoside deaminase [Planctomycetaceae bacterium]
MNRPDNKHDSYMKIATTLARDCPSNPFAAVLVQRSTGEIIASGVNAANQNPLSHGEIVCLNAAAQARCSFEWKNTVLYTTAEPCCMCMAAILWCRIPEVVFGTSIETLRRLGWDQFTLNSLDVADAATFADCRITQGVSESQCDALFESAADARHGNSR